MRDEAGAGAHPGEAAQQGPPLIAAPLRDGQTLTIAADGVRRGADHFHLAGIQDARQVSPDPETLALRVAGRGLVEFQPVEAGTGALALEALYRLRPDLRPPGFDTPPDVPTWWPPIRATTPPVPAHAPIPAWARPNGGATPASSADGRLTPYPRTILGLVGATFRLFLAHWRQWLALGLIAGVVPALLSGVLNILLYRTLGYDPFQPIDASFGSPTWAQSLPPERLQLAAVVSAAQILLNGLQYTWAAICLSAGAREALLGRPVAVGVSLRAGLRRIRPVGGSAALVFGGFFLGLAVPFILVVYSAPVLRDVRPDARLTLAIAVAQGAACLGLLLLVAGLPTAIYLLVRFGLAPFLAVIEPLDTRGALARSWQLTRGAWWRTLAPVVLVALLAALLTSPLDIIQSFSFAADALLAQPLIWSLATVLISLAAMAVLYDLRLRQEGYATLVHNI